MADQDLTDLVKKMESGVEDLAWEEDVDHMGENFGNEANI